MLVASYNLAIRQHRDDFYDKVDMIRLNSPWYSREELVDILRTLDKPKFLDINIKKRGKELRNVHDFIDLLKLAGEYDVDWVGISDVQESMVYDYAQQMIDNPDVKICAKIESHIGCERKQSIIETFDGIMVDNEDLATDIGWEQTIKEKEKIYDLCKETGTPCFRLAGVIFELRGEMDS